jgi:hypothetical protein
LLRAGVTKPTLSHNRKVEELIPRMRAVWPTVRKAKRAVRPGREAGFEFLGCEFELFTTVAIAELSSRELRMY